MRNYAPWPHTLENQHIFWNEPRVRVLNPQHEITLTFDPAGRMPWRLLPKPQRGKGYIYFFLSEDETLLYIGKANHPEQRLRKHKWRSEWWRQAAQLTILSVTGDNWSERERNQFTVESIAIAALFPTQNRVIPTRIRKEIMNHA